MTLDSFDCKILRLFQNDTRLTSNELAPLVNLSPSACHRRLARLRDDGVIQSEVAVIDPKAVGRGLLMIVMVTLEREQSDVISQFKATMRDTVEIMQCYYVTGAVDFVMILTAESMEKYDAFVQRLWFSNRNVKRFDTHVVIDRVKVGFELPIEVTDE